MFEHLEFWRPWSHITNTLLSQDIIFTFSNTYTSFRLQVVTDLKRKQMKIIYLLTVALSCSSAVGSLLPLPAKKSWGRDSVGRPEPWRSSGPAVTGWSQPAGLEMIPTYIKDVN